MENVPAESAILRDPQKFWVESRQKLRTVAAKWCLRVYEDERSRRDKPITSSRDYDKPYWN